MNNTNTSNNGQISSVLAQLEKFGFKFFGHGENNDPLVIAPNGQVIPLKVAYEFMQLQIKKASAEQSSTGNIETMPAIPVNIDFSPGTNLEKSPEKESSVEKSKEAQANVQKTSTPSTSSTITTVAQEKTKMPTPFDDGFKIKKFDPTDLKQVEEFINSNKSGSSASSTTWLATQFEKFLQEFKSKK